MSEAPIRIILVDDHKLVRESWKMLLESNPLFKVIALCEDGQSGIETVQKENPDIVLIDVSMAPLDGFVVTERILEINPSIKVIGISISNQPIFANRMFELGAKGFITKTSSLEEINLGIMEVHRGEKYISKEVKKNIPPQK